MATTSGWQAVGNVLGGGIDREGAFEEGRLRTARTENALLQARERQLKNIAAEKQAKALDEADAAMAAAGIDPVQARLLKNIALGGYGTDFSAGMTGLAKNQEIDYRNVLGNPDAPLGEQFAAGQAVQGKMLNPLEMMGTGDFVDIRALPPAGQKPDLGTTPLGESLIAENESTVGSNEALVNLRNVQAGDPDYTTVSGGGTAGGPGKPPAGYVPNPAYDPTKPIGEGNFAFVDARQPVMGAREAVFFNRIVGGAKNAEQTIRNIVDLPVGASAGTFGIGSKPGANLFTAGVDTLRNAVTSQDVQTYNTMIAGLDANLAQIEGHGLAASDAFRGQYDRLALREGDTEFTRLRKLAEMAQTIESGLDPYLSNPRVPEQQKQYISAVLAAVRKTIPFTHEDIAKLEVAPGTATLGSLIKQKGLDKGAGGTPGGPAPAAPAAGAARPAQEYPPYNDKGWQLLIDASGNMAYVSPDGKQIEEVAP